MLVSARRGIIYPTTARTDSADVPRDIFAIIQASEAEVIFGQGTLAARPTSTAGSPGIQGRLYMATDQTPHALFYDYGTGWDSVGSLAAGSVGTTQLADASVTGGPAGAGVKIAALTITRENMANGSIRGSTADHAQREVAQGTVSRVDLVAAELSPAGGAGGAVEALRALGAGAGNAAAGNDSRLSDQRVPTDQSVTAAKVAPQTFNDQPAAYSFVLADRFKIVRYTGAGAAAFTIPPNSTQAFNVGDSIDLIQWAAGQVTLTPGAGVTLRVNPGAKTNGQYTMITIIKVATDEWVAVGNLTT